MCGERGRTKICAAKRSRAAEGSRAGVRSPAAKRSQAAERSRAQPSAAERSRAQPSAVSAAERSKVKPSEAERSRAQPPLTSVMGYTRRQTDVPYFQNTSVAPVHQKIFVELAVPPQRSAAKRFQCACSWRTLGRFGSSNVGSLGSKQTSWMG